jgi:hypothetical protein
MHGTGIEIKKSTDWSFLRKHTVFSARYEQNLSISRALNAVFSGLKSVCLMPIKY